MAKERRLTREFTAVDAAGNRYHIREYTLRSSWPGGFVDGVADMVTSDGRIVDYTSKGVYKIRDDLMGEIVVTSNEPNAP